MSRRKLLLADDSITIQKVVNLTFADEGIDVVTVGDGDAALAHLASETPDILLADVNMPGPTGYEICEQLRANEATRGVPVILLVGSFEPFDEAEATRVGANAYLTKPFQSIKQLIAQVNELMDASSHVDSVAFPEGAVPIERAPNLEEPEVTRETVIADTAAPAAVEPAPKYFDDLGYENSTPEVETSTTAAAASEPDDIDHLYEQSVSGDGDLSDFGIDDEMIETSYSAAQPGDEFAVFTSESTQASDFVELPAEPEAVPEISGDAGVEPMENRVADSGFRSGYEQSFPNNPSQFEQTIAYENWQPADMRDGEGGQATGSDSSFAALSSLETGPLNDSPPQPVETVPHSPVIGEDTIRMEGRFDTTGASFKFDDVDLLDLAASAPVEITSPVNAVEQGGSKQVVTISPELIEMIAQRVVEKLSEKY